MSRFWLMASVCGALGCASPKPPPARPPAPPASASVRPRSPPTAPSATPSAATPVPGAAASLDQSQPASLLDSAPDGHWIAYCTADHDTNGDGKIEVSVGADGALGGDPFEPRLLVAGQKPRAIDELLARDPAGRFLLLRSAGHVSLLDTARDVTLDLEALGADVRSDVSPLPGHRAFAFDESGKHLAYLRKNEQEFGVVIRDLETGAENNISTGLQEVYRLSLAAGGRYAVLETVAEDTNENGRLDWPFPAQKSARNVCQGPLPRLTARYPTGDRSVKVVVPLDGGAVHLEADLVTPLGAALVLRAPSGELVLEVGGKRTTLAMAKCAGRLLFTDAVRKLALVACTGKKTPGRAEVALVGASYQQLLKVAVQPTEHDEQATTGARLVPLYPSIEAYLVDLEARALLTLEPGDLVIATLGTQALVRRGQSLVIYDAATQKARDLGVKLERLPLVLVQGAMAFVSPALVDLRSGEVVGTSKARPLALSSDGKMLVAAGGSASAERLAKGPLCWVSSEAAESPAK